MKSARPKLITLPNPHLRERSKQVKVISPETKKLVENMQAVTLKWEGGREHEVGVALAAVQVDRLVRVIVVRNDFEKKEDRTFQVFINPKITKFEGAIEEDYEGCLSIKDIYGKVPRYSKVRVKAQTLDGQERRLTAKGFLARVFQHEIDHTNGIVFIDHIKDKPEAFYKLAKDGKLEELDYEKDVKNNSLLW